MQQRCIFLRYPAQTTSKGNFSSVEQKSFCLLYTITLLSWLISSSFCTPLSRKKEAFSQSDCETWSQSSLLRLTDSKRSKKKYTKNETLQLRHESQSQTETYIFIYQFETFYVLDLELELESRRRVFFLQ